MVGKLSMMGELGEASTDDPVSFIVTIFSLTLSWGGKCESQRNFR